MTSQGLLNVAYAEEYDFVAGIQNEVTFYFRDGIETVNFPVFSTTSNFVSNIGSSFEVEGVVGNNPYLHRALDEAYYYRMSTLTGGNAFEYDYKIFDVNVNVIQNKNILKSFKYNNCQISTHRISTLTDDYESYLAPDTGFAIVNTIEFRCGGVHLNLENTESPLDSPSSSFTDYGSLPFILAEDVRTFLTFEFDHGSEKIESVIFSLTTGFAETSNAGPSFQIITAVLPHPLIDNAIVKSQKVFGMSSTFNNDFDVSVEFVNSQETLRGLDFKDCIVSGYDILTLRDKEEGYTGKRGFATAEILDVDCSGLTPVNPLLDKLSDDEESNLQLSTTYKENLYNMGTGPHMIATFNFNSGIEIVDFPEFNQGNLIARANPTFQLVGVPSVTPLLYDVVDRTTRTGPNTSGVSALVELFDVNLVLVYDDDIVRGFDYTKCRIVDYIVKTEHDGEESFYKGFALTDEFYFECQGYKPFNPKYDALFDVPYADTESSLDWQEKQRSTWSPNFR